MVQAPIIVTLQAPADAAYDFGALGAVDAIGTVLGEMGVSRLN
jgi:hypothetical protein